MTNGLGHRVRTRWWGNWLAVFAAVGMLAVALPAAAAASGKAPSYGPPGKFKVGSPTSIQVSSTVNGNVVVRATVPRKYAGAKYKVEVNKRVRATGRVLGNGKILARFNTRNVPLKRGDTVSVVIGGKVVRKIRI
jgi:hypothetical protein